MPIDFERIPTYIRRELQQADQLIERDESGMRVKRVQEGLNYHGFRTGIDASFGPATEACVKDFQAARGLSETGKVDPVAWEELVRPIRDALREPADIAQLSPSEAVRVVAEQHLAQHPVEIGGDNRGPWVRLYCEGNDGPSWAWCAGFVSMVMHQGYFYLGKDAPIAGSVSCDTLASQARERRLFVAEDRVRTGRVDWQSMGACRIFLLRRTSTDWSHTGFALDSSGVGEQRVFRTIEGNTNDEGRREGFEACRRTRSVAQRRYDFITLA